MLPPARGESLLWNEMPASTPTFPQTPLHPWRSVICTLIESDLSLEDFPATVLVFLPGCILLPFNSFPRKL